MGSGTVSGEAKEGGGETSRATLRSAKQERKDECMEGACAFIRRLRIVARFQEGEKGRLRRLAVSGKCVNRALAGWSVFAPEKIETTGKRSNCPNSLRRCRILVSLRQSV